MKTIFISLLFSWISLSAQNPLAYYPFTANANDVSGNEYNGTLYGAASANDTLETGNNANDFVALPITLFEGLTDFTILLRVKFNSIHLLGIDPLNTIVNVLGSDYPTNELVLAYNSNLSALQVTVKNTTMSFPFSADVGQWYCIYVIRNDNQVSVFIDGLQTGSVQICPSGPLSVYTNEFPCVLGQRESCAGCGFDGNQCLAGKLDDLKFYDFAFDSQQVAAGCSSCNDKVFYPFTFDASDYSGNNLDGSLHGNAQVNDSVITIGDNATDYLAIPDAALNGLQDFDVSFSVKFDALHDYGNLPSNTILHMWGFNWGADEFRVSATASTNVLTIHFWGSYLQFGFVPIVDQWYCFHVQRLGDSLKVYVNAQLIGTSGVWYGAWMVSPDGIIIGQQQHCPGGCFQQNQSLAGSLDNFKITNCPLPVPNNEPCITTNVPYISGEIPFSIFPNPADEFVKINFSSPQKVTASVVNMLGEEVLTRTSVNSEELVLPTRNLLPGIYLLELQNGNRRFSQKLVVNH